jgi:hypothetical protein
LMRFIGGVCVLGSGVCDRDRTGEWRWVAETERNASACKRRHQTFALDPMKAVVAGLV